MAAPYTGQWYTAAPLPPGRFAQLYQPSFLPWTRYRTPRLLENVGDALEGSLAQSLAPRAPAPFAGAPVPVVVDAGRAYTPLTAYLHTQGAAWWTPALARAQAAPPAPSAVKSSALEGAVHFPWQYAAR